MIKKPKQNLIFISHATPDDNEFVLWLSTRLKLAGYQVWSDVTQLFGGEKFWQDIEEAIAEFSCKFVLVITRTSLSKPGVKREVEYALAAEEKTDLSNFIIPIIIDDSSFSSQPYGLSERNIIPFRDGWAQGYARLLERVARDQVPRYTEEYSDLGGFISDQIYPQETLVKKVDVAVTNWLTVEQYPDTLNFYRLPIKPEKFNERFSVFPYPWFEYKTNFASFCTLTDIKAGMYSWEGPMADPGLDINAALNNQPTRYPDLLRFDLINKLSFMLSDAWSKTMRARGLHCYTLANGKEAFFFPDEKQYQGLIAFSDIHGAIGRRSILGFSGKNNVFWHYAVEAKALFGYEPKLCLIPHVVFTQDGKAPLADKKKMHRLRRGFCKNWWNDRWRDMLLAYLHALSGGEKAIALPVGADHSFTLSARPIMENSPVKIVIDSSEALQSDDEDVEIIDVIDDLEGTDDELF